MGPESQMPGSYTIVMDHADVTIGDTINHLYTRWDETTRDTAVRYYDLDGRRVETIMPERRPTFTQEYLTRMMDLWDDTLATATEATTDSTKEELVDFDIPDGVDTALLDALGCA